MRIRKCSVFVLTLASLLVFAASARAQSRPDPASTALAIAAGVDLGLTFSRRSALQFRIDYNPTLANGSVQSNIRFDAGLRIQS